MQEFSLMAPQHPKNAMKKMMNPTTANAIAEALGASLMMMFQCDNVTDADIAE